MTESLLAQSCVDPVKKTAANVNSKVAPTCHARNTVVHDPPLPRMSLTFFLLLLPPGLGEGDVGTLFKADLSTVT